MYKYAKDKLLKLLTRNGRPNTQKIQEFVLTLNTSSTSFNHFEITLICLAVCLRYPYTTTITLISFFFFFLNNSLFNRVDRNRNGSVSEAELRVFFLGLKLNDDDLSTEKDVEDIMESFDITGDAGINRDEFVTVMTKLVNDFSEKTPGPKHRNAASSNTKVKSSVFFIFPEI